jgi:hypothetical protein
MFCFVTAVMVHMKLARFRRVMMRVRAMTRRRVRVMRRDLVIVFFVVFRGVAMVARRLLMMIRGIVVVLACGMLVRHMRLLFR